ncbi:helix-turn-helix domain-containing protein [Carnobacterium mobile]|uniref:helix-turn-helix domain-containing protein n=1 Tax=Carnobacterium mobile TaxID=2750 RepID=UPI00054F7F69|nr:helix-turn-helix transcriptional regulator [Carnobacterium mobile]
MDLWKKINNQLEDKNITIYELTKKSGIAQNTLYELKSGRVSDLRFKTICKIVDALGIGLDEFRSK